MQVRSELDAEGLKLLDAKDVHGADLALAKEIFLNSIFPVLTPLAIDPAHPFPFIPNLGLLPGAEAAPAHRRQGALRPGAGADPGGAVLGAAASRRRGGKPQRRFIALESFLIRFLDILFPNYEVLGQGLFRLIRDSDVEIEEEAEDLVREFEAGG